MFFCCLVGTQYFPTAIENQPKLLKIIRQCSCRRLQLKPHKNPHMGRGNCDGEGFFFGEGRGFVEGLQQRGDDSYDKVQLEDGIGGWGWLGVFVGVVVVVGEEGWGSYGGWRLGGNRGGVVGER